MQHAAFEAYSEERFRSRLEHISSFAPGTVGRILDLQLVSHEPETNSFLLRGNTKEWMKNGAGTLHGGFGATLLDHGMGGVLYGLRSGEGIFPTIDMHVSYHRPLIPGKDVLIRVRIVSITRRLAHMAAEVYQADAMDRLCLSGTATYWAGG